MEIESYQNATEDTAIYPPDIGLMYTALGLAGEAGEVANKVKKVFRDDDGILTLGAANDIANELGDVLWYLARLATEINYSLTKIAHDNLGKLALRNGRKSLGGSGDDR